MGGEAMPQGVRMQRLADAGALGGFAASVPDNLVADGGIGGVPAAAREQPHGRLAGQPTIMGAQCVEQMGGEAMPQSVRMQRIADAGPLGGFAASVPDN